MDWGHSLDLEAGHPASAHRLGGCRKARAHMTRHARISVFIFRRLLFGRATSACFHGFLVEDAREEMLGIQSQSHEIKPFFLYRMAFVTQGFCNAWDLERTVPFVGHKITNGTCTAWDLHRMVPETKGIFRLVLARSMRMVGKENRDWFLRMGTV